jgi:hypothetical protein
VTPQSFELLARKIGAPVESTMQTVAEVAGQLAGSWPGVSQLMDKLPHHREWLDLRLPEISRRFAN